MSLELSPLKGATSVVVVDVDDDDLDSDDLQLALGKKKRKIWHISVKKLGTNDIHKNLILWKMLQEVDECDCTSELAATNADNPKGNTWSGHFDTFAL